MVAGPIYTFEAREGEIGCAVEWEERRKVPSEAKGKETQRTRRFAEKEAGASIGMVGESISLRTAALNDGVRAESVSFAHRPP